MTMYFNYVWHYNIPSASAINNTYLHILGLCGSNKYCVCLKISIKVKCVPKVCNICDREFKNVKILVL